MARIFGWVGLGVFVCVSALAWWGPPEPVLGFLLSRLEGHGIYAELGEVVYRPRRGFVLREVKLYASGNRVTPWFRAEALHVRPGFRQRWDRGEWSAKAEVVGGVVETELGHWADDLVTRQRFRATTVEGRMQYRRGSLRLQPMKARIADVVWRLEGAIPLVGVEGVERLPPEAWVPESARIAARVVEAMEGFSFSPLAEGRIRFEPDERYGERVRMDVELVYEGAGRHRGYDFTNMDLQAAYSGGELEVERARIRDPAGRVLDGAARVDFKGETAMLRLRNTLPRAAIEHLSPVPLGTLLEALQVRVEGRSDVELTFGPSPFEEFGRELDGSLDLTEAFYRDAYFPELSLELTLRDRVLQLEGLEAEVGRGRLRGPASGSLLYDFRSGRVQLDVEAAFNPVAVISLVHSEAVEQALREWEFSGRPPRMKLNLRRESSDHPIRLGFELDAEEVLSRGAYFAELRTRLGLEDRILTVGDLHAARGEEALEGWLRVDLEERFYEMDVSSTIHFPDLAPLIGEAVVEWLRPYRMRGDHWLRLQGGISLKEPSRNRLEGKAVLRSVAWRWLMFDMLSFSFFLEGDQLEVPDIEGELTDGGLTGTLRVTDLFDGEEARFALEAEAQEVDLFDMITAATDTTDTPYTGTLFSSLQLAGALQDPAGGSRYDTYEGEGSLEIREGELFRIPLLLGLSRILSRVVRGFGYASQTDFSADFTVGEGKVRSENLFLQGRLLSIEGEGKMDFDRNLEGNVKVQLLGEGVLSEALNLLTWPLRKLIEVRLSGTLDDPQWEPRNLPRELFGR